MLKGIFFDLYGTLLEFGDMEKAWADWLHFFYISLKESGLKLLEKEFSQACEGFFSLAEPEFADDSLTVFEKRIKSLCLSLKLIVNNEKIHSIADRIVPIWQKQVSLDPDAIPVLEKLQHSKNLALISNFDHPPHVRRLLQENGLEKYFSDITISAEVGIKKPDPGIFHWSLLATRLGPDEIAYVGDTDADIKAALAAGMQPVLIRRKGKGTNDRYLDYQDKYRANNKMPEIDKYDDLVIITSLRELLSF